MTESFEHIVVAFVVVVRTFVAGFAVTLKLVTLKLDCTMMVRMDKAYKRSELGYWCGCYCYCCYWQIRLDHCLIESLFHHR